jgi:hypothetical protein
VPHSLQSQAKYHVRQHIVCMSQGLRAANSTCGLGHSTAVAAAVLGQQCIAVLRFKQLCCSTNRTARNKLCQPAQAFKNLDADREQGRRFRREVRKLLVSPLHMWALLQDCT